MIPDLDRLLRDFAAAESVRPVRATSALLRLKAELARREAAAARNRKIERWAFAGFGVLLASGLAVTVGEGGLAMGSASLLGLIGFLALAGGSLAFSLRA
jgi:hypothetical protein